MGWSGRAPALPAREAGKGRSRQGARHVSETQPSDRRDAVALGREPISPAEPAKPTLTLADCGACRLLHFPHRSDKTKALARQCFDKALFMAGIADRASSYIQAGRQCRIGHDAAVPNGVDEIIFADDALPVADQVFEQVEHLWCDDDDGRPAMQL